MKLDLDPTETPLAARELKKRRRRNEGNAASYDADTVELLKAIDAWRTRTHRSIPAHSEVLQLLRGLGWRKVGNAPTEAEATPTAELPIDPVEPVEPDAD